MKTKKSPRRRAQTREQQVISDIQAGLIKPWMTSDTPKEVGTPLKRKRRSRSTGARAFTPEEIARYVGERPGLEIAPAAQLDGLDASLAMSGLPRHEWVDALSLAQASREFLRLHPSINYSETWSEGLLIRIRWTRASKAGVRAALTQEEEALISTARNAVRAVMPFDAHQRYALLAARRCAKSARSPDERTRLDEQVLRAMEALRTRQYKYTFTRV